MQLLRAPSALCAPSCNSVRVCPLPCTHQQLLRLSCSSDAAGFACYSSGAVLQGAQTVLASSPSRGSCCVQRPWSLRHPRSQCVTRAATRIENYELVIGDVLSLLCFALWKQVAALASQPDYPGWLAPLSLNPVAVADFLSFCLTLVLTWVASCMLVGGYNSGASRDVPSALRATSLTWLVSMPVILAQLVLVTAIESRALVGQPGFGNILPLAASGPGEPLPSAAGVLGLMVGWRAYYTTNLDWFADVSDKDKQRFKEAVGTALLLSGGSVAVLQVLYLALDRDVLEAINAWASFSISEAVGTSTQ